MDDVFHDRGNADDVARKNRVYADVVGNKSETETKLY